MARGSRHEQLPIEDRQTETISPEVKSEGQAATLEIATSLLEGRYVRRIGWKATTTSHTRTKIRQRRRTAEAVPRTQRPAPGMGVVVVIGVEGLGTDELVLKVVDVGLEDRERSYLFLKVSTLPSG